MKLNILGIKIDNLSKQDVLERINSYITNDSSQVIVTPNPEFVLKAQKDEKFRNILNKTDIAIPDGTGLVFASWWLKHLNLKKIIKFKNRIHGSDIVDDILNIANRENKKIFILSIKPALSSIKEIKKKIAKKYPKLIIDGIMLEKGDYDNKKVVGYILGKESEILFTTFGAPRQEKWIWENLAILPDIRIAAGVGGTFDFITGKIKRAPKIFKKLGLEWIWRFLQEPKFRIKRIYQAFIVFTWKVFWFGLKTKLSNKRL